MKTLLASDGLRLCYAVDDFTDPWKPSDTVVLVHAAMGSSRRLYAWVPHLARDFRVVRPDLRGHGGSDVPGPGQLSFERMIQDVVELLDELGSGPAHIAGSGGGAIIALGVAIEHPDRVKSLGIYAAPPGLKNAPFDPARWLALIKQKGVRGFLAETITDRFDSARTEPGLVEWFLEEAGKNSSEFIGRYVPMMRDVDFTDRLREIRCPTLVVASDDDPLCPMEQYELYSHNIPDCQLVVLQNVSHNFTDSAPDRCAEELHRFLRKQRS